MGYTSGCLTSADSNIKKPLRKAPERLVVGCRFWMGTIVPIAGRGSRALLRLAYSPQLGEVMWTRAWPSSVGTETGLRVMMCRHGSCGAPAAPGSWLRSVLLTRRSVQDRNTC
jgi:hypothetical protein